VLVPTMLGSWMRAWRGTAEEKLPSHEVASGSHVGGIGVGAGHQPSSLQSGGCTLHRASAPRRGGLYEDQADAPDEVRAPTTAGPRSSIPCWADNGVSDGT